MKTVEQNECGPVQSEKAVQWVLADDGGKDLWKRWILSLKWNIECVMEGKSDEQVKWIESVTSSGEWFMQSWAPGTLLWMGLCIFGCKKVNGQTRTAMKWVGVVWMPDNVVL